jgi:curved DNA-binding protein CbpA
MKVLTLLLCLLCLGLVDSTDLDDPYEVLGVPRTASQGEIRKAYKKLALLYHPDKTSGEADKFSSINAAYDLIGTTSYWQVVSLTPGNPDKRAVFDDFGKSSTGRTGFNSYWEFVQSNTKSENDFYVGDPLITRLTEKLWKDRVQGDQIWLVKYARGVSEGHERRCEVYIYFQFWHFWRRGGGYGGGTRNLKRREPREEPNLLNLVCSV